MLLFQRVALVLGIAWCWQVADLAQQPPFVARTELVQVDVAALDNDRKPILDLTKKDFRLLEDGKPRPILAFTRVDLPTTPGSEAHPTAPSTGQTAAPLESAKATAEWPDEGRLVVIVFDRSIPMQAVPAARKVASAVVDALGPTDLAAIVRTSQFAGDGLSQEFTTDRVRLRKAIASPYMGATAPPTMGPGGLMESQPGRNDEGDCWCGRCVLDGIRGIAEAIRDVQRLRKVLVFIGSDIATPANRGTICLREIDRARSRLLEQLTAANITVHAFDPLGLTTDTVTAGAHPGFGAMARRARGLERRASLSDLPQHTGGRTVVNTNTPEADVRNALDESRTYYLLGFQPASEVPDGRYHRIEVEVLRRVATLTWRKGYHAKK